MRTVLLFALLVALPFTGHAQVVYEMTVAQDGSGDFESIQAAIDATKAFPDKRITIHVKNGIYHEPVKVYEWNPMVSLIGESAEGTVITWGSHFKQINKGRNSTFHTPTVQVNGDDFHGENLTIRNTAGPIGQAIALAINADRVSFYNSRFLGHQDTVYVTGEGKKQYFKDCYIEGTTDFIFGRATAVFEGCQLHSLADSYITAASTPQDVDHGLVFFDATLTANTDVESVYLGRPWRAYAQIVFINTQMGEHIRPEGWHNWSNPEAERQSFYAEHNSLGPGAASTERVSWSHQLTEADAERYSLKTILGSERRPEWYLR
ncbi:pectinesterase family protein [Marinimicrobium locisalis]|uniref:pectinesterase family protein n=1 Tax=Marinimicrobium locisalis TaxID=546022 RepID=UPI003222156B